VTTFYETTHEPSRAIASRNGQADPQPRDGGDGVSCADDAGTEIPGAEPVDFRALMATFPTGVAVVTAFDSQGNPRGMTVTSISSVSIEPPIVLVCIRHGSPTLEAILQRGGYAVNLLHGGAESTSRLFASGRPDRFDAVRWHAGPDPSGPHLPDDTHSVADLDVLRTESVGDHQVVFGRVFQITWQRVEQQYVDQPLLYGYRRYEAWPALQYENVGPSRVPWVP
jgi:flavin reductase (NADH)